jgi:putative transposase
MKGTRHSEEQIIAILKQGEAGMTTAELCRQHGITEQRLTRFASPLSIPPYFAFQR